MFVVAIFDPVLAGRCPDPLLPVAESLPGHLAKGKQKRKSVATTLTEGVGTDGAIVNSIGASIYHHGTVVNQDADAGDIVVEGHTPLSFVKVVRSGARYPDGTLPPDVWREEQIAPTLSLFDMGDVRTVVAIVEPILFENSYRDGARIANDGVTQTLSAKMGTGGGNTPMVAIGIQGNVIGRQDHNGPAGKGYTEEGDPMFTLTSTDVHAVAINKPTLTVRRLTPLECERLMGWPDGHTRYKADGTEQSDTQRYKQCGNGIASPVAAWIGKHVMGI